MVTYHVAGDALWLAVANTCYFVLSGSCTLSVVCVRKVSFTTYVAVHRIWGKAAGFRRQCMAQSVTSSTLQEEWLVNPPLYLDLFAK